MRVTGDPAVLNDVGADALRSAEEVHPLSRRISPESVMAPTVLHDDPVERALPSLGGQAAEALEAFAGVLSGDAFHLQRAARELADAGGLPGTQDPRPRPPVTPITPVTPVLPRAPVEPRRTTPVGEVRLLPGARPVPPEIVRPGPPHKHTLPVQPREDT